MSGRCIGVQRRRPVSNAKDGEHSLQLLHVVRHSSIDALVLGSVAALLSACAIGEKVDGHQETEAGHTDTSSNSDSSSTSIDTTESTTSDTTNETPAENCNDGLQN